jgi:prepilin-type N-terminal cleavage/methylation domain-containing protein
MRRLTGATHRQDEGFTLIELLISIAIVGIIAAPLSGIVLSYFKNALTTNARLSESKDEQIVAAYWQQDVASVGIRSSTYDSSPAVHSYPIQQSVNTTLPCALPTGQLIVTMAWDEYDAAGSATRIGVGYILTGSQTPYALKRIHCTGSSVDSTARLADDVVKVVSPQSPNVVCTGGGVSGCSDTSGKVPTVMSLTLNIADPSSKGQPYTVTLTGKRRQT